MSKKFFSVKRSDKIALVVLSSILFVGAAFWFFIYYLGVFDYMYHSQDDVNLFYRACVISAISLALLVSVIVLMFKGKRGIRIACAILLIISIPVSAYLPPQSPKSDYSIHHSGDNVKAEAMKRENARKKGGSSKERSSRTGLNPSDTSRMPGSSRCRSRWS